MLKDFAYRLLKGFAGLFFLVLILAIAPVVSLIVIVESGMGIADRVVQFGSVALISSFLASLLMFLFYYLVDKLYFGRMGESFKVFYATIVLDWIVLFEQVFYIAYTLCFVVLILHALSVFGEHPRYLVLGLIAVVFGGYHYLLDKFEMFKGHVRQKYGVDAAQAC